MVETDDHILPGGDPSEDAAGVIRRILRPALAHEDRLRAFRLLIKAGPAGLAVSEIQRHLGIPASTLSHHVSRLVWCGLVSQTREGRVLRCRIEYDQVRALLAFLQEDCCAGLEEHRDKPESA